MYPGFLHTHSLLRYFVLLLLVIVIVRALIGLVNKKPFNALDNRFSLYLLIFTHLQLVAGLVLYFVSRLVKFGPDTMSDKATRYWTVEHLVSMLIAIVLITVARVTMKRMPTDIAKHRRLLIFNAVALVLILSMIYMSGRPIIAY